MLKKYLFVKDGINQFGYIPRSNQFSRAKIKSYGKMQKEQTDYSYIAFSNGDAELSRYDEKTKRWSILCFPSKGAM